MGQPFDQDLTCGFTAPELPHLLPFMTDRLPSLKWLQTFRLVAHHGSIQATALQSGQSISTVSHHLQCLENHVAVALVDHSCRPMTLTAQGAVYLRYVEDIFDLLEQANGDIKSLAPHNLQSLRFAMIDDFDTDIGPEITRLLATILPQCQFTHFTRVSHEILEMFRDRTLDIGIASRPQTPLPKVQEIPILRDPFVLAVPAGTTISAEDFIAGRAPLPFLRYMRTQMMGAAIEAQLDRMRIKLENTFELDSSAAILSLVARGSGWAITTPSTFARTKRFQAQVQLLPLPRKEFARTISVFVAKPHLYDLAQTVSTALRSQLSTQTISPITDAYPWLAQSYRVITD